MSEQSSQPHVGEDTVHYQMHIHDLRREPVTGEGYEPIVQETTRGPIQMRYYSVSGGTRAAIFVGGAGGGFDTPVNNSLYPQLCRELQQEGIAALRVRFRDSHEFEEAVLDVLAGISFLEADHVTSIALVGHSLGGAVVIQAAALSPSVRTCVALATQRYGADSAAQLGPRCSLLLAHGLRDEILPPDCSRAVYKIAKEPKRLLLNDHARHCLDEWGDELPAIVRDWIRTELSAPGE